MAPRSGRWRAVYAAAGAVVAALATTLAAATPHDDARGLNGGSAAATGSSPLGVQPATARAGAALAALPLTFAPNVGQASRGVRFTASGPGVSVAVTRREVFLSLLRGRRGTTLGLRFVGASAAAGVTGADGLRGRVNDLRGNDPAAWKTRIPTYASVVYGNVWPGIDVRVSGKAGALKYAFVLRPGARVSDVRLAYRGIHGAALASNGSLVLRTPLGPITDSRPVSYQRIGGKRVPVESSYALGGGTSVGFAVGAYDRRYPLVIDPELVYSTYLGGSGNDNPIIGAMIDVDERGHAYIVSSTTSPNFPTTPGAFQPVDPDAGPGIDVVVAKLSRDGSSLVYSTYLGGSGTDAGNEIAVDEDGAAYVAGFSDSANYPTTPGAFDRTYNGATDMIVTKLNPGGSRLLYSTYVGGPATDEGGGLDVDRRGNAYLTGTSAAGYPVTPGSFDTTFNGGRDTVVTKLNPAGSALVYSTYLGGTDNDVNQHSLAVDKKGRAHVAVGTKSTDYPTTPTAFQPVDPDPVGDDAAVTKLNVRGSELVYSTYLGGPSTRAAAGANERPFGLTVDVTGRAYVSGRTDSLAFPTTAGAFDTTYNGGLFDSFVAKFDKRGSRLLYSTYLGGSGTDRHEGIAVDRRGRAHVSGRTTSPDFPVTADSLQPVFGGIEDAAITVFDKWGSALVFSSYLGGTAADNGWDAGLADHGEVFVSGATESSNFPTTLGSFQPVDPFPTRELFVAKLDLTGSHDGSGDDD